MLGRNSDEAPSGLEKLQMVLPNLPAGKINSFMAAANMVSLCIDEVKPKVRDVSDLLSHVVQIPEDDEIFDPAFDWVLSFLEDRKVKKTRIKKSGVGDAVVRPLLGNHVRFKLDGHRVTAKLVEGTDGMGASGQVRSKPKPGYMEFRVFSMAGYKVLVDRLYKLYDEQKFVLHPPKLHSPTSWGGFSSKGSVPPRTLESVILKADELDLIISDMKRFLESEDRYLRLGLPWHRGYLFYGCAGTGKTSIAKAISAHFGLDVYSLSIGDIDSDNTLNGYVDYIKPRSVFLLEDIDVFSAATSREAEEGNASLSGLLNVLDGIATPHGMITIMTTNHIEKLDEALIRPGRIDVKKEFTELNQDQGERLFEHFYGYRPDWINFKGLVPSSVVGLFTQNLDDDKAAAKAIQKLREGLQ